MRPDLFGGNPERLMAFAGEGHLSKLEMADLLTPESRAAYLDVCAAIEKEYTEACTATNDPCLDSGCALDDEICLQPLVRAEVEYQQACAAEWIKRFKNPKNRASW
ncbi:MAG: hypothetical protein HY654_10735 [Acidobacteria bacterium]|nr:hypothetical protein [Acidobacteriota bacterium]